jgi:hypothetical protein
MATKSAKGKAKGKAKGDPKSDSRPLSHKATQSKKSQGASSRQGKKFIEIPYSQISLPPRPAPGEELSVLFYNPRPLEEVLDARKLNKLIRSIRLDGLIENPVLNIVTDPSDRTQTLKAELLAGERRYHAIGRIIAEKLPCVDDDAPKPSQFASGAIVNYKNRFGVVASHEEGTNVVVVTFDDEYNDDAGKGEQEIPYVDVFPTRPGDEVHANITCKLYYDLTDERKMRISFNENENSDPLSVKAEVDLVERMLAMGYKQQQVAYILDTNITFISQRSSFRTQLPAAAFEKLMAGKMAAHVAVNILSYKTEHRQAYFDRMEKVERRNSAQMIQQHRADQEKFEDEAEEHESNARKAEKTGDPGAATRERRKAQSAASKASRSKERKEKAESEAGTIRQGHAHQAAAELGITPRTAKIVPKEQIEDHYVKGMAKYVTGDVKDPVCGEIIPGDKASIVRRTAKAILEGILDPLAIIREYMVENGEWAVPDETGAATATATKSAPVPQMVPDKAEDEDEIPNVEDEEDGDNVSVITEDAELEPDESTFDPEEEDEDEEEEDEEEEDEEEDEDEEDDDEPMYSHDDEDEDDDDGRLPSERGDFGRDYDEWN